MSKGNRVKVAFCSSEVFPFRKTGGLADVSGALPFALAKEGCEVKVFTPFYKNTSVSTIFDGYGYTKVGKVEFYFIRNDNYFMRDGLYGTLRGDYPDNLERFSFFSGQVLTTLKKLNFSPAIIHCNDWQTALVSAYLKCKYQNDRFFSRTRTVFTIHNMAYQGVFDKNKYPLLGISRSYFDVNHLEYYGRINLLKGGIIFSDLINTVSPTYAKQIQTPDYGCGLDGVLRENRKRLSGILNAVDYKVWNPATDKFIYKNYSSRTIEDKYINKRRLQQKLGLEVNKNKFLLGMVSRITEQKGIDIIVQALPQLVRNHQVVILGLGDERHQEVLRKQAVRFKGKVSVNIRYDERFAHQIYASCDAFLMPSRFEPCGLAQMISYKYGTVPVVYRTGGLIDTVIDLNNGGGGFVFDSYESADFISAVERAVEIFDCPPKWNKLIKKIIKYNFSWELTAKKYVELYQKAMVRLR